MFGMFFMGALYLQKVLGYDAIETGLAFLPVSTLIGIMSLGFAERLITRFGPRAVLLPGLSLAAAGLALFSRAPVDGSYVTDVLPVMVLLGVGAGLSFAPIMTLAMSGATREDAGLASGLINTMQQVGGALGLAVLATLATSHTDSLRASGSSVPDALTSGYHLAFLVAVGLLLTAIAVTLFVVEAPAREAAVEGDYDGVQAEAA
jgi:MFS family permease